MKLLIVRHGETLENLQRVCQGQMHGTLSKKGMEEAKRIGKRLKNFGIDVCYTSDLKRATDTTAYILAENPHLPIYEDARLRERFFGSFQGQVFPESLTDFAPPEETETPEAIIARLLDFIAEIQHRHANETVLMVSHGFTIRVLMSILMRLPTTDLETVDDIRNTSLSIAEIQGDNYEVILFNDTAHLK